MDLKTKHMRENNKYAMIMGVIIQVFMIFSTVAYKSGRTFSTGIMLAVELICMAVLIVGYLKWSGEEKCHYPIMLGLAISYMVVLIGSVHTPYMYAFGFLIGIAVVIYNDAHMCIIAGITAVVENLIYVACFYKMGGPERTNSTFMVPTNMVVVIIYSVLCYLVIKTNGRQTKEIMDDIERRAIEQEESAKKIADTAEKISDKLEEADQAMIALSEKVHSSAEAVEQISSSVSMTAEAIQTQTEMNSNIMNSLQNISEESKEMQELSNVVKGNVDEGNKIITELKAQAEETAKVNAQTAEMTEELAKSAETVKDIVSAILSISSQTNLLALNASIEAARAGEAGKGFAVVAEEIRTLSEDTKQSAEEIGSTIETLITSVHGASDNMQKSVESSDKQGIMIKETGEKFATILESVNALAKNVADISDNVSDCAKATSTVMDSITDLSATSEEVAASSESSLTLSYECAKDMDTTNAILEDILRLSRHE